MSTTELLSITIRISLLLAAGYVVARLFARKSATIAHRVLVITFACAVAVPVMAAFGPGWQWAQPAWATFDGDKVVAASALGDPQADVQAEVRTEPIADDNQVAANIDGVDENLATEPGEDGFVAVEQTEEPVARSFVTTPATVPVQPPPVASESFPVSTSGRTIIDFTIGIWLTILSLLVLRLLLSLMNLARFVRRCGTASNGIVRQVEGVKSRLGLACRVDVVVSSPDAMPMACWLGRWMIVLPSNFLTWSGPLQQATLVHELGHVSRRDAWSDMLVQAVFCVLWPNPFSWLAVRDVRRFRERACDEWALQKSAIEPKSYAQSLLEVVQRCQAQRLRFASTMVGKKDLESRVQWLMSTSRPRVARPAFTSAVAATIVGLGIAIATGQPVRQGTRQSETSQPNDSIAINKAISQQEYGEVVPKPGEVILSRDPSPATPAISVAGVVTDTDGKPLGGMHVVLKARVEASHQYARALGHNRDVLARTRTTADGRFEFAGIGIPPRMTSEISRLRGGKHGAQLVVWGEGKALNWEPIESLQSAERQIRLEPQADVSGTVVTAAGVPVLDAELKLIGLTKKTRGIRGFYDEPGDLQLYLSDLRFRTKTREGHFSVSNIPSGYVAQFACGTSNGGLGGVVVKTGDRDFGTVTFGSSERSIQKTPIKLSVTDGTCVRIKVVDHAGKPITSGGIAAIGPARSVSYTAEIGPGGIGLLRVNRLGRYRVMYASDPLSPKVGLSQYVDVREGEAPVVVMRIPASNILQGTVVDGETGAPILGAYVTGGRKYDVDSVDPQPTNSMAVTDHYGTFRLPVMAGENTLSLRHAIDGYFVNRGSSGSVKVTLRQNERPDDVVIKVSRGLTIRGIVRDKDGRAVQNARVSAANDDRPYRKTGVTTDKNGVYLFKGFSPYASVRIVASNQSGAATVEVPANPDHPAGEPRLETINLKLAAGTTVTGRVVRNGKPVVGIGVKLKNAPPDIPGQGTRYRLLAETTTDAEGRYRLVGLRKGEQYALEVETSGNLEVRDWHYQTPYVQTVRTDDAVIEIPDARIVSNGQELRGIVVDPDGKPIAGVQVGAELVSGGMLSRPRSGGAPPWTQTDQNGRFHLTSLPEERIKLSAYRANPAGGRIRYSSNLVPDLNADDIKIILDPKLGSGIEDLDEK